MSKGDGELAVTPDAVGVPTLRSRLFHKYVMLFILAVWGALCVGGAMDIWTSYRDQTAALIRIQHEQAEAAAGKIGQFIRDIEAQIGWTIQLPWSDYSPDQQRFDALRLLHLIPAITELARIDPSGREQLRVSRLTETVIGDDADLSRNPEFVEAMAHKAYYGPVYFRRETEPYMTVAVTGAGKDSGVTVAEISLKYIWDVVSGIKVGKQGAAYVVDAQGKLIAHPDLSLVLRNTDLSGLAQVQAARAQESPDESLDIANDMSGRRVLTANAAIPQLGWLVFVELPIGEAYAPLYASLRSRAALLLAGLGFAVLLSLVLAGKMVRPIRALQAGAARIGAGRLDHRIQIATGDELEALGDQFNGMAARLQESYATLEGKVIERTRQLELANLAKTRFLAAASHDLRQPLHALGLLVAQLNADTNRADRRRIVARVGTAVSVMNDLFNALLDISKLDAGAVEPDVTAFPIDPLLRKIETMFAADARAKSLRLRLVSSDAWVRSDRVLLERILLNLVSNAVRYTQRGGIVLGCRRRGSALLIQVWDSGVGIPEDQRQNIFREFYQVDGARTSGPGPGLGLGLAIVDRLCSLLDHRLELASTPGKGSQFSITVPRAPPQAEPAEVPHPLQAVIQPFTGKFIVVIDDDRLVLDGVCGLLRGWGCDVSASTSSTGALAGLHELRQKPDLIISDHHFTHGENGISVIERLRDTFNAPIPALLVTGDISVERKQEAEACGYELLQKPVPPMVLRAAMSGILRPHGALDAPAGDTAQPSG